VPGVRQNPVGRQGQWDLKVRRGRLRRRDRRGQLFRQRQWDQLDQWGRLHPLGRQGRLRPWHRRRLKDQPGRLFPEVQLDQDGLLGPEVLELPGDLQGQLGHSRSR
jgi:hypothetical protein